MSQIYPLILNKRYQFRDLILSDPELDRLKKHPDDEEPPEDIPYEEVIPEDAPPRKDIPDEFPGRKSYDKKFPPKKKYEDLEDIADINNTCTHVIFTPIAPNYKHNTGM